MPSDAENRTTQQAIYKAALEKAEQAMRLNGWHLCLGSNEFGAAEAFAAWEVVDEALHPST